MSDGLTRGAADDGVAPADVPNEARAPVRGLVLLGSPVARSLSPVFQNAALRAAGLDVSYTTREVAAGDLDAVLDELRRGAIAGNVTAPHKGAVASRCDVLTPTARRVGAVNTFWWGRGGTLVGDNTDVVGVRRALDAVLPAERPTDWRLAILGAGGAAAATLAAAVDELGARVNIWSRSPDAAAFLAARYPAQSRPIASIADVVRHATVVVNATPLGRDAGDPLPCSIETLPADCAVLDLVYAPQRTPWVDAARASGRRGDDGLRMLVEQGAAAFQRWFGAEPDHVAMWDAIEASIGRRPPDL